MTNAQPPVRIALACQGGGSHTAFTAGALSTLLRRLDQLPVEICAFSGTSGGALCSLLAWYGLLLDGRGNGELGAKILGEFWQDNAVQLPWEQVFNDWMVNSARLRDSTAIPTTNSNPYGQGVDWLQHTLKLVAPRREFVDLRLLLEKHVNFNLARKQSGGPRLLLSAVDVLSGEFRAFDSRQGEISVDAVLASSALPKIFKAVRIGKGLYWDGLLSQNPPLRNLLSCDLEDKPDEIWLLRVNPQARRNEPKAPEEIEDRRNELAGNLSLNQELANIDMVNRWLADGRLKDPTKKPIRVRELRMDESISSELDHASKLDRSSAFIEKLVAHGVSQMHQLLDELAKPAAKSQNKATPAG